MAIYFNSGEGRCPRLSDSVTHTYTRTQLNQIKDVYEDHDALVSALLNVIIQYTVSPVITLIKGLSGFENVSNYIIENALEDFITTNIEDIGELLCNSTADTFKFKLKLRCINKGQNGHYWVINSFEKA